MSDELHENWVPEVAERTPELPDQEWVPEHARVEGFERETGAQGTFYRCLGCDERVRGTYADIDRHRTTHA